MNAPIHSPLLLSIGVRDRQTLGWILVKAPFLLSLALQPIRDSKAASVAEQFARVSRVGRDPLGVVDTADYGHSIRQIAIYAGETLLRGPDVEISEQGDLSNPNRVVRRARRCDPLWTLKQAGTIDDLGFDAGEKLRDDLERSHASMPAGTMPAARTPPWGRLGVSDIQRVAMAAVRDALDTVSEGHRLALLWLLAGGSVSGFARLSGQHHQSVSGSVRAALKALVEHYRLGGDDPT